MGILFFRWLAAFRVQILKHLQGRGGTKSWTFEEVQGYPSLGAVGSRGFETDYFAGGLEVGDVAVFQIWQGGGNGQGENLTLLKGSVRIYMEIGAAQADVPEDALTLKGGVGIGHTGVKLHREGDH